MSAAGRPLRFIGYVIGGWVALRAAFMLPEALSLPQMVRDLLPVAVAARAASSVTMAVPPPAPMPPGRSPRDRPAPGAAARARVLPDPARLRLALLGFLGYSAAAPEAGGQGRTAAAAPIALPVLPRARGAARFTGAAWLAARAGGRALSDAGQLGGAQAGVRLRYGLGTTQRLAATARLSAPLEGRGSEAALGVEWRPAGVPVAIIAEQRFGIDGTPGGPALFAVGGVAPTPVAAGFVVEGYGQAGAVARGDAVEPFADGAVRMTRPLAGGIGLGGAQRDAARLDLGPTATIAMPVAGRSLRLSLDWRQRVAGNAAPGSGLAVTLGADF